MFDKHTHTLIAQRLDQAEKQREQIRAISLDYPEITIEDAYAVQREWVRLKIAEGRTLKGHKIGLTSKAMQASSQISEPDYGALLDDMAFSYSFHPKKAHNDTRVSDVTRIVQDRLAGYPFYVIFLVKSWRK